jgi:hypothetical protein
MKRALFVLSIVFTLFSCEKNVIDKNIISKPVDFSEKTIKNAYAASLALVPSGYRPTIAFLPDGVDPYGAFQYDQSYLRRGIYNSSGVPCRMIINPNQFLGLPVDIGGLVFTGLAVDRTANYYDPPIMLCRSRSSEHALFFAALDATNNYIINSYLIVNSSFAPASSGWKLSYIECHGQIMYGIFYNSSLQESKIAQISKTTGNTILVKTFSGIKFEGMDFTNDVAFTGVPDKMYLKSGAAVGNTVCKIYILNLSNGSFTTNTTNIPTNYSMSSSQSGSFLTRSYYSSPFYIYDVGIFAIYGYDPITNINTTFCTADRSITLTSPITFGPVINFGGYAIDDAAS